MASILVADDDPILRMTVREYLQDAGHAVEEACDGVEALQAIRREQFDLLILDMLMPNKDGLEVIMELRQSEQQLRILAISSGGRMDTQSLLRPAMVFGATAMMSKPLLQGPLIEVVERLLQPD